MFIFLKEYIRNPRSIGAVAPSGKALAKKMMEPINFEKANCIVEYGPGLGSFTREIIKQKRENTELILIEKNQIFYEKLKIEFGQQKGVNVIWGNAENVNEYLQEKGLLSVDYIVSGLPFTSLPGDVSEKIFCSTMKALGRKGKFITFQYSMVKKKLFEKYFIICKCFLEIKNLPPAYVIVMKNRSQI